MMLAPHAIAADKFSIYVYKNGVAVTDASVTIWNGGDKIDSGYTDSTGKYISWLDGGVRYKITASKNGQDGEWEGFPDISSHKIRVDIK